VKKGDIRNVKWSRQEIIELIGETLYKDNNNGPVGIYGGTEKIVLYDIKYNRDKIQLIAENLAALLYYLELETHNIQKESQLVIKKKTK